MDPSLKSGTNVHARPSSSTRPTRRTPTKQSTASRSISSQSITPSRDMDHSLKSGTNVRVRPSSSTRPSRRAPTTQSPVPRYNKPPPLFRNPLLSVDTEAEQLLDLLERSIADLKSILSSERPGPDNAIYSYWHDYRVRQALQSSSQSQISIQLLRAFLEDTLSEHEEQGISRGIGGTVVDLTEDSDRDDRDSSDEKGLMTGYGREGTCRDGGNP